MCSKTMMSFKKRKKIQTLSWGLASFIRLGSFPNSSTRAFLSIKHVQRGSDRSPYFVQLAIELLTISGGFSGKIYLLVAVEQFVAGKIADLGESGKKQEKFGSVLHSKVLGVSGIPLVLG